MFHITSNILNILYSQLLYWELASWASPYAFESRASTEVTGVYAKMDKQGVVEPLLMQTTKGKTLFQDSLLLQVNKDAILRTISLYKRNTYWNIFHQLVKCVCFKLPAESYAKNFFSDIYSKMCLCPLTKNALLNIHRHCR